MFLFDPACSPMMDAAGEEVMQWVSEQSKTKTGDESEAVSFSWEGWHIGQWGVDKDFLNECELQEWEREKGGKVRRCVYKAATQTHTQTQVGAGSASGHRSSLLPHLSKFFFLCSHLPIKTRPFMFYASRTSLLIFYMSFKNWSSSVFVCAGLAPTKTTI